MTRPILADAFAHHVWATDRILEACEALTPDALATTVPGTYGSIIDTLRHLVAADSRYLVVLTAGRTPAIDDETVGAMGPDALRARTREHADAWQAVAAADLDAEAVLVRHRPDGSSTAAPIGVRLAQALHHGTDHRSQVCTALTALGVEPPSIDVWDWADAHGKLEETPAP